MNILVQEILIGSCSVTLLFVYFIETQCTTRKYLAT